MTSVTYSMAYKRKTVDFENATVEYSATVDVPDRDDLTPTELDAYVAKELKKSQRVKDALEEKVDGWMKDKIEEIDRDLA